MAYIFIVDVAHMKEVTFNTYRDAVPWCIIEGSN